MKSLSCANRDCPRAGTAAAGRVVRHGFYRTKWGRRRRYRCRACGKTFCTNTGTPYHRLHHRRAVFDEVAALSVEGLNTSAIARVRHIAWNTVDRWQERAADSCRRFNARTITRLAVEELQADEIRTIVGGRQQPPSGSSLRSTSGHGSGLRRWSGDGVTATRSRCFKM